MPRARQDALASAALRRTGYTKRDRAACGTVIYRPHRCAAGRFTLWVMSRQSPLLPLHQHAQAVLSFYEAPAANVPPAPPATSTGTTGPTDTPAPAGITLVQTYGPLELEYASIRKASTLLDMPQRATIVVSGSDRLAFLNRMVTQELKNAKPGDVRRAFWLNRKGRIDADLRVLILADQILLDVDVHAAERTRRTLDAYVITEDVQIEDQTERYHRLSLHGPAGPRALGRVVSGGATPAGGEVVIEPDTSRIVQIAGVEVIVDRADSTGEIGLELLVPTSGVLAVYEALLTLAHEPASAQRVNAPPLVRPIGFAAWNIARLEAGTPVYYLDFGPDSLPGETGVLDDRVSFTKGCYLGQEIVARMNALGHPRRRVVAIRISDPGAVVDAASEALTREIGAEAREIPMARFPGTGAAVYAEPSVAAAPGAVPVPTTAPAPVVAAPVGAITSSTLAPLLSRSPIALAMVAWASSQPNTRVLVDCDGAMLPGVIQEKLTFVQRPAQGAAAGDGAVGAAPTQA